MRSFEGDDAAIYASELGEHRRINSFVGFRLDPAVEPQIDALVPPSLDVVASPPDGVQQYCHDQHIAFIMPLEDP